MQSANQVIAEWVETKLKPAIDAERKAYKVSSTPKPVKKASKPSIDLEGIDSWDSDSTPF